MQMHLGNQQGRHPESLLWLYLVLAGCFGLAIAGVVSWQSFFSATAKPTRSQKATVGRRPVPSPRAPDGSSQAPEKKPAGAAALPATLLPSPEPFQEIRGPFQLAAGQENYTVVLHGLRLKWPESAHHKFDSDQTMHSFEIKDAAGQVLYQMSAPFEPAFDS